MVDVLLVAVVLVGGRVLEVIVVDVIGWQTSAGWSQMRLPCLQSASTSRLQVFGL
ncbi:MAG: hypothetical protein U0807_05595 [Candidatus Binatia bacterium]